MSVAGQALLQQSVPIELLRTWRLLRCSPLDTHLERSAGLKRSHLEGGEIKGEKYRTKFFARSSQFMAMQTATVAANVFFYFPA